MFKELPQLCGGLDDSLRQAAERLAQSGAVSDVRVLQAGAVVTGIVASQPRVGAVQSPIHRVYIGRRPAGMESECSCGERALCVHSVAVLIVAEQNARRIPGEKHRLGIEAVSPRPAGKNAHDLPAQRQRLYYRVDGAGAGTNSGFQISVSVGQAAAGSERAAPVSACPFLLPAAVDLQRRDTVPRYIDDQDREILQALKVTSSDGPWELRDSAAAALLQRIVATGRAFWQTLTGEPMRPCDLQMDARPATVQRQSLSSLKAKLVVSADLKATLHFIYNGLSIDSRVLRFDSLRGGAGILHVKVADTVYEIERDPEGERQLQMRLDRLMPAVPQERESWLKLMLEEVPVLQTQGWEIAIDPKFPYRIATPDLWYADLQTDAPRSVSNRPRHDRHQREWFDLRLGVTVDGHDVNLLPVLVNYLQTKLDRDVASPDGNGAQFHRIGERLLIRLDDGRYLPVALERIDRIAGTLVELFDRDALNERQALPVPRSQASRLSQLAQDLAVQHSNDPAVQESALRSNDRTMLTFLEELKEFSGIKPLQAPKHFPAALRPYQEEGLGWLQFLRRYRLGGILADDMGLGKTVQTLAHLALEKEQDRLRKPALIVAPVSVIGNWQREIPRFAPNLKLLTLHGPRRKQLFGEIEHSDIVVTGYPQLQLDSEELLAREFGFVILDEAQTIRNPRAKVSQAARALRAEHRLCLTGTPMENHLGDLWSLFDFAQPGLLGAEQAFARHYRAPIEKNGSARRSESLTRRIAPFILRRTKDAVAKELPAKTQVVESIVMEEQQRDLYDSIRLAMHRRVREVIEQQSLAHSQITVLNALLKLRQACCDPRLLGMESIPSLDESCGAPDTDTDARSAGARQGAATVPSAKMEWLATMLPELVAEGRRILLFSQFTSMLKLIEAAVAGLSISYLMLTGATRERQRLVERFQAGEAPLFLISLKAGGTGLNLTAADTVIHYDPWWNPAAEAQATDRTHRIGQDKPVFVHKLVCQDTVEEKILQLQSDKQSLAGRLYTERNASPSSLSAVDLEALFAP